MTWVLTLLGTSAVMLFRDWTLEALLKSLLTWPVLGMAMLIGIPVAAIGLSRIYFYTAFGGAALLSAYLALA